MSSTLRPDPRGASFLRFAPQACIRLAGLHPDDARRGIEEAERALAEVPWQRDAEVVRWMVSHPLHAITALACLADEPYSLVGERIAACVPELAGLAVPATPTTYEHEPLAADGRRPTPLLDRSLRALAFALPGASDLAPADCAVLTTVLLFSDVAKGGTPAQRASWLRRLGVDGTVHNEDSAMILEDVIRRVLNKAPLSEDGRWSERVQTLCAASGLCGMRLRGEVGRDALAPLHRVLRREPDGGARLGRVWSLVNAAETSAVRAGLWTPALAQAFADEETGILAAPTAIALGPCSLAERLARVRGGALLARESYETVQAALTALGEQRASLEHRLSYCRLWYAEAALGALSLEGALRLLVHLAGAAVAAGVDVSRPWHLDLLGVVPALRDDVGGPRNYPVRLLEALLSSTSLEELARGRLATGPRGTGALASLPTTKGGEGAIAARLAFDPEAQALLTLLAAYERRGSAEFHRTLKALCDLYALRKDDFDRVANEASYLATMNAARSDKSRMLDFVVPGLVVEVGPGGGVVLDLLAERFHQGRIVGLDASQAVVEAHAARIASSPTRWEMIHGDAFELPAVFGEGEITTVIFCSVLHEIFSYVPWGEPPKRFQLGSVEALVRAAFRALAPGGRIIVRDGIAPADEPRVIELRDATWREGLLLFAKTFEARQVPLEELPDGRFRLGQRDLYEFLTTFTWGPAAFPYEIREQRGVLPRAELVELLLAACEGAEPGAGAREVPVPDDLASYLQPGYPANIEPHVAIFDAKGATRVPMPDVQGVVVIERVKLDEAAAKSPAKAAPPPKEGPVTAPKPTSTKGKPPRGR